ncbi:MAG: T9SS type A sorting domain-containing protein, partial [Flavobacteriaceae bacterium]
STLDGLSSEGEWKLIITDYYFVDSGTLMSWGLDLGCFATSSTDNFNVLNTKIYPNPNNGNFTVEFDSGIWEDATISVFDINGRKIFDQTYSNTGKTSQNISLNDVQAGVYIVKINGGTTSEIHKIIVR